MTSLSPDVRQLIIEARFQARPGASAAAIERTERALGVQLPAEFRALWEYSDGLSGDGIEILSLAEVEKYVSAFGGYGFFPFTDCNDSNPYAVWCRGPLQNYVAHVYHDDEPELICCGLRRFLELVVDARANDEVDRIPGDFDFGVPLRTNDVQATARDLVLAIQAMDPTDNLRGQMLRFAAQLFGTGSEGELARLMVLGDEYTRRAVQRRWQAIDTPEAQEHLRQDENAYQAFLNQLQQALEAAGMQTKPDRREGFRLMPGNVGLNFPMLFSHCRQPGAVEHWVQTFKERQARS